MEKSWKFLWKQKKAKLFSYITTNGLLIVILMMFFLNVSYINLFVIHQMEQFCIKVLFFSLFWKELILKSKSVKSENNCF